MLAGAIVCPGTGSAPSSIAVGGAIVELMVVDPMFVVVVDPAITESAAGHSPVLGVPSLLYKT